MPSTSPPVPDPASAPSATPASAVTSPRPGPAAEAVTVRPQRDVPLQDPGETRDPGPVVEPVAAADLAVSARLHVDLLARGLFPRLGVRFTRRFHECFRASDHGCALIVRQPEGPDGSPAGILVGATDQRAFVQDVLAHHKVPLAISGIAGLLRRPRLAAHFVHTRSGLYLRRLLRRRTQTKTVPAGAPTVGPIGVVHAVIASPHARGIGVGAALLEEFAVACAARGTTRLELVTEDGAGGAGGFYRSLGWEDLGAHADRDGHLVRRFRRDLDPR